MRWKILWLITALAATSRIDATRVNINNFLKLHVQPTKASHTELNVSETYDEKIHSPNFMAKEARGENDDNKINLNSSRSEINHSEYTNSNQDDLITMDTTLSHKNVTNSSLKGLFRIAGEKIPEDVSYNFGGMTVSRDNNKTEVKVNFPANERRQREVMAKSNAETATETQSIKTVETEFGKVDGFAWEDSEDIIAYYDIPYGQFSLFEEPTKPEGWERHSAREHTKRCPQMGGDDTFRGSTDCLTLSIFAPKEAKDAGVLFYIHEGASNIGSGNPSLYGPKHLVKKGVILVLPNYRLGTLGFLCLDNSTAPGNAALKDLTLALEWIKNNIKEFGGNPSNIVLSGDGTAGALAGHLALSDRSKEHISKVISESGAVLSHWAIDRTPLSTATRVAERIRILTGNYVANVFSEISIEQLVRTTNTLSLKPCLQKNTNGTITRTPWYTLNNEAVNISFIIGSANHAALRTALEYDNEAILELNENFGNTMPNDLVFPDVVTRNSVAQRIREQYFGTGAIAPSATKSLSQYHTDVSFLGPDLRLARILVEAGATVYLYEFSFVGDFNNELQSIDIASRHGATRGDIVGYLFSQKDRPFEDHLKEAKVIGTVTDLWVSFIEHSRPAAEGVTWNYLNVTEDTLEQWLSIGEEVTPAAGFHHERLRLWTELYREYFIDRSATAALRADRPLYYAMALCLIKISKNVFL